MNSKTKLQILIWFPVLLLPLSNLFSSWFAPAADFNLTQTSVWVIGAIAEELFYRYFLLQKLLLERTELKPRFSIVLVSLLFAGMHLFNLRSGMPVSAVLIQAVCAFCFSVWAGAVVWRTHSVMVPLLAHILMNLTAFDGSGRLISLAASLITLLGGLLLMAGSLHSSEE